MLRFSEEVLLLVLDDEDGKPVLIPPLSVSYAFVGGVLMDLALEGRIDTDPEQLVIVDSSPIGDDVLDPVLARIAGSKKTRDCYYWIEETLKFATVIRSHSLRRLIQHGVLRHEDDRFLRVFGTRRRYAIIDGQPLLDVKQRLLAALFSEEIPDVRDIALISLADGCGIFKGLLSRQELKEAAGRIEQIGKLELICRDVVKAASLRAQEVKASTRPRTARRRWARTTR